MNGSGTLRREDGVALLLVLLILAAVGVMALAAVASSGSASLISMYEDRQDMMESVTDAGLESARGRLNSEANLFPDSGYVTLESNATVKDGAGQVIPNMTRSTYAGPMGIATGQYGIFGMIVSVTSLPNGTKVVRRSDVMQESFAKYAYFTNEEGDVQFGGGDQISGPVHSNDIIKIGTGSTKVTFRGPGSVTTARTITGKSGANFTAGYQEGVARIEMPTTADLGKLKGYATAGGTAFDAPGSSPIQATMRIEFLNINNQGFFRVYRAATGRPHLLMANENGFTDATICGYTWVNPADTTKTKFITPNGTSGNNAAKLAVLKRSDARCYPAGDPRLNDNGAFQANGSNGTWVKRPFALSGTVPAAIASRPDIEYLFPLDAAYNPNFKGVIHVTGRVAISGTVRGRVTLAATDDIFIIDDTRYALGPGTPNCDDILGLFAGNNVVISDNDINTPQAVDGSKPNEVRTYDESSAEFLDAIVLALNGFTAQNYGSGPTDDEPCGTVSWGRGCLYLSGGVIQETRGPVGTTSGTGYLKRYSYDVCGFRRPPPYYPTTGRFARSRYFEVDPAGFDVKKFFDRWAAN